MVTQLLIHMIVHLRDGNISLVSMEIVVEKSKAHPFPETEVHIERTTSAKEFMSVTAVFEPVCPGQDVEGETEKDFIA